MDDKAVRAVGLTILLVISLLATGTAGALSTSGAHPAEATQPNTSVTDATTPNTTPILSVSGTVSDHTGTPTSGIRVAYHNRTYFESNVTTNGTYGLTLPSSDQYAVELRQNGGSTPFANDGVPGAYAAGHANITGDTVNDIQLPEGHDLTVKVVDQSGNTIENATVDVIHINGNTSAGVPGQTNAQGLYVPDVATNPGIEVTGQIKVRANAPGHTTTRVQKAVTNSTTLTIELQEAASITGTIEGSNGQTATADKINLYNQSENSGNTTWTAADGSFSATVANGSTYELGFVQTSAENNYTASFPKDGIPDLYAVGTVDAGTNLGSISLPEPSNVTVNVVGPNGSQLSDVPVRFHHQSGDTSTFAQATTNANGSVTIEAVGDLHISTNPTQSDLGWSGTDVTVTGDKEVTLNVPRIVTASGNLSSSTGQSLAGYEMVFQNQNGYGSLVPVASDGSFSTTVPANNEYNVVFRQENSKTEEFYPKDGIPDVYAIRTLSVGSENASVGATELPEAHRLNVTIVNESGAALSGVPVYLKHEHNGAEAFRPARTNQQGELVLERASTVGVETNGTLSLYVDPVSADLPYLRTERTVEVTQDENITITVSPAVDLNGTITYADGSAPTGYTMHAWGQNIGDSGTIRDAGNYTLRVASDNQYELIFKQLPGADNTTAFPKDDRPDVYAVDTVSVGTTSLSVNETTLPVASQLNVTVVNQSGSPLSGVDVDVIPVNGDVSGHHNAFTNEAGEVVLDGASTAGLEVAGEVRISVTAPDGSSLTGASKTYTVTADRNETITLSGGVPVTGRFTYADGTNVSGYIAELFGEDGNYEFTNKDGSFRVIGTPNQTYRLGFKQTDLGGETKVDFPKDGRPDIHAFGPINLGTEPVDVGTNELPKAHMVNVTVVNQTGAPVSGLDLDVTMTTNAPYTGVHTPATTNANGNVVLDGAASPGIEANGTLRIRVQGTGTYLRTTKQIEVNQSRNVTITLGKSVAIEGRFVDTDGNPFTTSRAGTLVPNERISVSNTNETGVFRVRVASNQTYQVGFLQRDANGTFGPHDGIADLYRPTEVTVGETNTDIGTHEVPDAAGLVNVRVVNESGAPVQGADVVVFPANGDNSTRALGWVEPTDGDGYFVAGDQRGIELNGSTKIRITPPSNSDAYVSQTLWRNITVTGDRNITVTLTETAGTNRVTGTWTYPNGSAVSDVQWSIVNFVDYSAGGQTNASGMFTEEVPADVNQTFNAYIVPMNTGDGIVDAWNIPINATGGVEFTEQVPAGYEVSVEATTVTGEPADTIIRITNNVNASATGWYYEYGTGRALDPAMVATGDGERPWRRADSRDLVSGSHNATVIDAWTHDQLGERVISVNGSAKTVTFELDRYPSIDQSSVDAGTVARDIQAPTLNAHTTDSLLANGFNVRLTAFGTDSSTNLTITEQLPDGYQLNQSYGSDAGPVGITYDGSGSVSASYSNETNTLTLDITGSVSDIRYRVVPVADGREVAVFSGTAGKTPIEGETYLGDAPLSGTITLPSGSPAGDAIVVARPLTGTDGDVYEMTDGAGDYQLSVPLDTTYAVGYYDRANSAGAPAQNDRPDLYSIETVDVAGPTTLNATLPDAHNVTVQIVDSDGDPLSDESVDVSVAHHLAGFDSPAPSRLDLTVADDGTVMYESGSSTLELAGNVSVTVTPTTDTGRFTGAVTQNVTVTSDQTVTVTLPEEQQAPTARVNANNTSVVTGDSVFVTARDSTDNSAIATTNWTITGPNGNQRTAVGPNVTFDATAAGNWTVSGTVTDVAGNTDTAATTVTANSPANVAVSYSFGDNASDGELTTAEMVTVVASVHNDGDLSTTETVAFVVDGEVVDTRDVTIAGGESTTVSYTTSLGLGTHNVGVRDVGTTELEVFEPADLAVTYGVSSTDLFLSDVLDVTATVANDGGVTGTKQVALTVGNQTVTTTNVTVGAGETETVDFTYRFPETGTYDVTVNGQAATPVTVEQATNVNASVSITAPADGSIVGDGITVEYAASNTTTGIQAVVYQVNDGNRQTVQDGLTASSFEITNLSDGSNTVTVWLRDNAGNLIAGTERTVTVDTTRPSVSVNADGTVVGPTQTSSVNVTVNDETLNTTTAALVNSNNTVVETIDLTDRAADGQATVTVDATANGARLPSGTYTLQVTATDEAERTADAVDTVTVDTTAPAASNLDISGTVGTSGTDYLNASGSLTVTGTVTDAGASNVSSATVVLVSQAATYNATKTVGLNADGSFSPTLTLEDAPAGEYTVVVRATDAAGNTQVTRDVANFIYDDTVPTLGASISAVNATDGRVTVTADEPLTAAPTVTVTGPDSTSTVEVTKSTAGVYTATFEFQQFGNDGKYSVTATGTDLAGQSSTATSNTSVDTNVRIQNGTALIETSDGAFINLTLDTNAPSDGVASLSTSDTPLAELSASLNGSQFIEGELGTKLSQNLTSAEIGIPRSKVSLPPGVNESQIEIRRYNETTGQWENVGSTTIETRTVNGTQRTYVIVDVSHFSTYGAVAADAEPPTIDAVTLSDAGRDVGTTYNYSTDTVSATVEYSDDISGINASAVQVYFNGQPVGQQSHVTADVTSNAVTVTATDRIGSGKNTVTVIAADEAGKTTQNKTTFTVSQDTTPPELETNSVNDSETLDYGTTSKTLTFTYNDALSGVNDSSVTVTVDGTSLSDADTIVDDNYVAFDVTALSPGDSTTVSVTVTDEAGNAETVSKTFSVAQDTTGPTLRDTTYRVSGHTTTPPFPANTTTVTATLDIADTESGVDPKALTVRFGEQGTDLETVTSQASVTDSSIEYTAIGLAEDTTYVLNATLVDESGNTRTIEQTFGVAADTTAPTVIDTQFTPSAATESPTFDPTTSSVTTELSVADDSAVNTAAVVVKFGERGTTLHNVTSAATVTEGIVRYNNDSLESGTTYDLSVTLVDVNGNERTITRTFTVAADTDAPVVTDTTFTPTASTTSPTFEAGTDSVSVSLSTTDKTSINESATVVKFGKEDDLKTVAASVSGGTVSYDATGLTSGTAYELEVTLVDESGNARTVTRTFSVASPSTDDEDDDDPQNTDPVVTAPDEDDDETTTTPTTTTPTTTTTTPTTTTTTPTTTTTTTPTTTTTTPTTTTPTTTTTAPAADETTPSTTTTSTAVVTTTTVETTESTTETDSGGSIPGFTGMTALVALAAAIALVFRKRRHR